MLEALARAVYSPPDANVPARGDVSEAARLEGLHRYQLLDTAPDACFDRIAALAAQLLKTPIALLSLVDTDREWFKARRGLDLTQIPRRISFGNQVVQESRLVVVRDAKRDAKYVLNPLVSGAPFIRFYAGIPLRTADGHIVGALAVMDTKRRDLGDDDTRALASLAAVAMDQIELHFSARRFEGEVARRSASELALRENEKKFRDIASCASDWFWESDADGRMTSVTIGGRIRPEDDFDPTEIVGRKREDIRDPFAEEFDAEAVRDAVATRVPFRRMILAIRQSGRPVKIRTSGVPFYDGNGEFLGYRGAGSTVTQEIAQQEELRKMANHNRLLVTALEASSAAVTVFDVTQPDWPIVYVNPAFTRLTGFAATEMLGQNVRLLGSGKEGTPEFDAIELAVQERRAHHAEMVVPRKDGTRYTAAIDLAPVFDDAGSCCAYVSMFQDVSDERAREQRQREGQKLVALGELAGGVAHEINNLLQPALMLTEVVADRLPAGDTDSREDLAIIRDSALQARDIVKNVLLFARKEKRATKVLDLSVETFASLALVRNVLPPTISIAERIPADPALVQVSRTGLTQVLTNLVLNAVYAMDNRGVVTVSLGRATLNAAAAEALGIERGSYALLSVADTGCGIASEVLPRVFEPFFTTKPVGQGTGLGLSVAYGIVRDWKGAIAAQSELGKGTIFTIYLPLIHS